MKNIVLEKNDEFKLNFRLHSIILLVGPDGSGKTKFSLENLSLGLKNSQTGRKKIKIAYISSYIIMSELMDADFKENSFESQQLLGQTNDILFNKIKNFTSYPANSDFVIIDTNGLSPEFRSEILKIGKENHYNVTTIVFDYTNKSDYYLVDKKSGDKKALIPGQMKLFKQAISGGISQKEFTSVHTISSRNFDKYKIEIEDYEQYEQYMLPDDEEFIIIGDIHGCFNEFVELLKINGFDIDVNLKITHPDGKKILLVGDLIDKGQNIKEVVELVYNNLDIFKLVIGNHESLAYKKLSGSLKKGGLPDKETIDEFF